MAKHIALGKKGEALAKQYLEEKGYKIVETNWRHDKDEIDMIAMEGNELVIVEVKARSGIRYEHPSEAVTNSKIKRIVEAAEGYILDKNWEGETRFDVITVIFFEQKFELEHFKEAFYPTL